MALSLDDASADSLSALLAARLTDGFLELYSAADALLLRTRLPLAAFETDGVNGGQKLAGEWFGTCTAGGTATKFKLKSSDASISVNGTVSGPGGGGDVVVSNPVMTFGQLIEVLSCLLTYRV